MCLPDNPDEPPSPSPQPRPPPARPRCLLQPSTESQADENARSIRGPSSSSSPHTPRATPSSPPMPGSALPASPGKAAAVASAASGASGASGASATGANKRRQVRADRWPSKLNNATIRESLALSGVPLSVSHHICNCLFFSLSRLSTFIGASLPCL